MIRSILFSNSAGSIDQKSIQKFRPLNPPRGTFFREDSFIAPPGGVRGKTTLRNTRLVFSLFLLFITIVSSAQKNGVKFTDITEKAGITFKYTIGDFSYKNIIESSGSGITIFDYNNDNLMDLFLMNGTYLEGISDPDGKVFRNSRNSLYKNNGDGTFTDMTEMAGLINKNWSMAAGAIDIDNDGDQDLYLLNYGPNVFYRNNGNGTFTDITHHLVLPVLKS